MQNNNKNAIEYNPDTFDKLLDIYKDNPIPRVLIAAAAGIPLYGIAVSGADAGTLAVLGGIRKKRLTVILDELAKRKRYLAPELVQKEEFIYAFMVITQASLRTKQAEKIKLFVRLLTHACKYEKLDSDDFEENIQILEELSPRELLLMQLYKKHEDRLKERAKDGSDHRKSQLEALEKEAEETLGIPQDQLSSSLSRLARTGLYKLNSGGVYFLPNDALGDGSTTAKFIEFSKWLLDENDELKLD